MSRSGYSDDCDSEWSMIMWRGAVKKSIRGKRGQGFLKKLLQALEQLPNKRLQANIICANGECCAIGALVQKEGGDVERFESNVDMAYEDLAKYFDIAPALVREIMYENDEQYENISPERRYELMVQWVKDKIIES